MSGKAKGFEDAANLFFAPLAVVERCSASDLLRRIQLGNPSVQLDNARFARLDQGFHRTYRVRRGEASYGLS